MSNMFEASWQSPLGLIKVTASGKGLTSLYFDDQASVDCLLPSQGELLNGAISWLQGYFAGARPEPAALALDLGGTEFMRAVWRYLLTIPYGTTQTYGEIAKKLGSSPRAIGRAISLNPVWLLIPCHRVIGAQGKLTGYAGGLERKRWLLHHEGLAPTTKAWG